MRLIRLTVVIHILSHLALWGSAVLLFLDPWPGQALVSRFYHIFATAVVIQLGAYHWAMAQWQDELCDDRHWPASIYTAISTLVLGILALLWPMWSVFPLLLALGLLVWQESWGQIARYMQPWYLRLRWLQMISLILTKLLVVIVSL